MNYFHSYQFTIVELKPLSKSILPRGHTKISTGQSKIRDFKIRFYSKPDKYIELNISNLFIDSEFLLIFQCYYAWADYEEKKNASVYVVGV